MRGPLARRPPAAPSDAGSRPCPSACAPPRTTSPALPPTAARASAPRRYSSPTTGGPTGSGLGLKDGDGVDAHRVDGRPVFCYAQDPSYLGGSLGEQHADSIVKVLRLAGRAGAPVVGFIESGGARMQEGTAALAGYARLADGHWGAFAVLINGTKKYGVPRDTAVDATREALTPFLQK